MKLKLLALLALAGCSDAPASKPEPPAYQGRQGGYLGMFLTESSPTELRVDAVDPGSCAEMEGFRAGDVISEIRGGAAPMTKNPCPLTKFVQMLWMPSKQGVTFVLKRGEVTTTYAKLDAHPAPGDPAPDFTLKTKDGAPVTLSQACKARPVLLIFGSWT